MTTNQDLLQRRQRAVARGVAQIHNIFIDRAENAEMWDVEGRRYIDFAGGIAVLPRRVASSSAQDCTPCQDPGVLLPCSKRRRTSGEYCCATAQQALDHS